MNNEDVTRFCKAVEVLGRIVRAQITMEGMKADNMVRVQCGESVAFHGDNFTTIIRDEHIDYNDIVKELLHG